MSVTIEKKVLDNIKKSESGNLVLCRKLHPKIWLQKAKSVNWLFRL